LKAATPEASKQLKAAALDGLLHLTTAVAQPPVALGMWNVVGAVGSRWLPSPMWVRQFLLARPHQGKGCHTSCLVITQPDTCTIYRACPLPASLVFPPVIAPVHKDGFPLARAGRVGVGSFVLLCLALGPATWQLHTRSVYRLYWVGSAIISRLLHLNGLLPLFCHRCGSMMMMPRSRL
jgi:hypothetical protein